ncbi:MAG: hypothetical protein JWM05_55, partial [Acidimicrobiales bacterium]|nr:hypothetical protein [Acidimicrobiales bacterium]
FSPAAVTMFAELGDRLNDVISQAAYTRGVNFVSLAHVYQGHEACTPNEQWINGLIAYSSSGSGINIPGRGSYHPKSLGHQFAGPEVARVARATSPISYAPFATLDGLIKQQFVDFAGRQPTSSELTAWHNGITAKTETADDLIVFLAQASAWSDHRAALVRLYWAYFQRVPDLSGFDYWLTRLQAGTKTLAQVSSTYAGSSEFVNKYGNLSNADFVAQIYRNIYDREPDASGHVYWTAKLDRGEKTRGEVMLAFSEASEGIRHLQPHVDTVLIHLGTLRAMPARSVFDAWVEGIPAGVPLSGNVRNLRLSASYDALH